MSAAAALQTVHEAGVKSAAAGAARWCLALLLCAGLLAVLSTPSLAEAETLQQVYARAIQQHYAGRYQQAIDGYERILAVPLASEDLHYNLGCAYFRLGKLGPAIYHFERALRLDPGAEDARFNLEASRSLAAARVKDELKGAAGEGLWAGALGLLRTRSWTIVFLVMWWLCLSLLLLLRYMPAGALRAGLLAGTSLVGIATLVCGLLFLGRLYQDATVTQGIVLPDQMAVREGPSQGARTSFKLHAGFRVRLQQREDGWVRIRLPNGLEGWVMQRELGVL